MVRVKGSERERLEAILGELGSVGDVEGTAVISRDGLLIASDLPKNVDAEIFSSMTATMHGAGETAIQELKKGVCKMCISESDNSQVITLGVNPVFLLVGMTRSGANLGLIRVEMKKAAQKIAKLI